MSNAVTGVGTSLRRWTPASGWVEIAEVLNITGPGKSRETIDVTSLDSTDGYRDFIGGFREGGTWTFSMIFSRDTYEIINDDFESDTIQNYEIFLADVEATSFEFEGLVTELPLTIVPDDKITVDVTIQVKGIVTINSGSGSSA